LTVSGGAPVGSPISRQRYQLANQLESACVEVTETAAVISYDEYFPFGMTSFRSADGSLGVSARRYRYNGKERDEETRLDYYGARYYASWVGRWISADPLTIAGRGADLDAYAYVHNRPVIATDPVGLDESYEQRALYVNGEQEFEGDPPIVRVQSLGGGVSLSGHAAPERTVEKREQPLTREELFGPNVVSAGKGRSGVDGPGRLHRLWNA